ncbi:MAG: type II CAAX endopeptidase family protein [Planctomycetota bacterium]
MIIEEISGFLGQAEVPEGVNLKFTAADIIFYIFCFSGTVILAWWFLRTSMGRRSLDSSPPRRNNMPLYLPFVPLAFWLGVILTGKGLFGSSLDILPEHKQVLITYLLYGGSMLVAMLVTLLLARETFVRRLKGFGLDLKTAAGDFGNAVVYLIAIFPVIMLIMLMVNQIGRFFMGEDFQMQQHEGLEIFRQYGQWSVRIVLLAVTVLIGPILEELLFRGLFQTMLRGVLGQPWRAIGLASVLFVLMHHDWMHFPALFILSVCMGYAYEKSGSLLRPIFIHCMFNGINVTITLLGNMCQ